MLMYTETIIPRNEAARISAISEDVEFAVVAGCADVIGPCDTANTYGTPFDFCGSHMFASPADFWLHKQGERSACGVLSRVSEAVPSFVIMVVKHLCGMSWGGNLEQDRVRRSVRVDR